MNDVEYRIRYFANGEEKIAWLFRFEIKVTPIKQPAGFGRNEIIDNNNSEITLIEK